jgi:hypothetical protein
MKFQINVYLLDQDDNRTDTILYSESVRAKSKIEAYSIVGKNIKDNGIHTGYKHHYTMIAEQDH